MNYKFNALNHGLHSIRESKNPGAVRGRDGCLRNPWTAGRSGCTPAEPYPPDRQVQIYMKKRNVPGFPVDKPHTRPLAANISPSAFRLLAHFVHTYVHTCDARN